MQRQRHGGVGLAARGDDLMHLGRMRHARGVGERDAVHAHVDILRGSPNYARKRLIAFERASECGGDRTVHAHARAFGELHHAAELLE